LIYVDGQVLTSKDVQAGGRIFDRDRLGKDCRCAEGSKGNGCERSKLHGYRRIKSKNVGGMQKNY
jgi:hypothetical protein